MDFWWLWAIAALVAGTATTAAAQGFPIVDLELAGTAERANDIVRGVDLSVIRTAILWDFLFILFYAPALFLGSLWARRQFVGEPGRKAGTVIAAGGLAAGVLDMIENVAMLGYLDGRTAWIPLSAAMAIPKFILAFVAIVYIVVGIVLAIGRRATRGAQ